MFMHESQNESEESGMPIMIAVDTRSELVGIGMIFARVVPNKGVQSYAVKHLAVDIGLLGYPELVLKSDGEPAIVALKEAVKAERPERIVLESSPVKESKSNGTVESAIQRVQGQIRAIKDCLEGRIGERIGGDSPLVPWLVMHAARTLNRFHVGQDGKTAYRRWKGKNFHRDMAEFGESIMYLKAGSLGHDKFNCRWERGIWLGIRDDTAEVIVGTEYGVIKARDSKRLASAEERWNLQHVRSIAGTPWEPIPGKSADAIPVRIRLAEEGSAPIIDPASLSDPPLEIRRRSRITREDVVRIGYTLGCPGCKAISRNAPSQNHTEVCRARIEEALIKEGGIKADRIHKGKDRMDEHKSKKRMLDDDRPSETLVPIAAAPSHSLAPNVIVSAASSSNVSL